MVAEVGGADVGELALFGGCEVDGGDLVGAGEGGGEDGGAAAVRGDGEGGAKFVGGAERIDAGAAGGRAVEARGAVAFGLEDDAATGPAERGWLGERDASRGGMEPVIGDLLRRSAVCKVDGPEVGLGVGVLLAARDVGEVLRVRGPGDGAEAAEVADDALDAAAGGGHDAEFELAGGAALALCGTVV